MPYGYTYAARKYGGDGQIRIHEEDAALVRQVFAWYAEEGATFYSVRKKLVASPWRMRRGGRGWCSTVIRTMLRCEWYIGRAYSNRVVCEFHDRPRAGGPPSEDCPKGETAIGVDRRSGTTPSSTTISSPVCNNGMEENRRFSARRLKRKSTYLLRGLLKCGRCGYTYVGHTVTKVPKKGGFPEYRYYMCSRYESPIPREG